MSKHDVRFPRNEVSEQVLGLDFDWDEIPEIPGEPMLAGLDVINRKILVNEKYVVPFDDKAGL